MIVRRQDTTDRTPPHNPEAEAALIGACLIDPTVLDDVRELVPSGNVFYLAAHAIAYDTILSLVDGGGDIDLVQVQARLRGRDEVVEVGGIDYLARLVEETPSAYHAERYAGIVARSCRLRRAIANAEQALYDAHHADASDADACDETIAGIEARTLEATSDKDHLTVSTLASALPAVRERMVDTSPLSGISTGIAALDEMTGGLQPGEMIICGARPSMGKSALALKIAYGAASQGDPSNHDDPRVGTFFVSAEMTTISTAQRLVCMLSGVSMAASTMGGLDPRQTDAVDRAIDASKILPIHFDDTPGVSVAMCRQRIRRMVRRHDVRLVVVDYLQMLRCPDRAQLGKTNEVGEISAQLKAAAKENGVPLLVLAQLNRNSEGRDNKRPGLADLRDSGNIEQDADVVMLLHREEYHHRHDTSWAMEHPEQVGVAELIVAKQRNGATGTVRLKWDAPSMAFRDMPGKYGNNYGN